MAGRARRDAWMAFYWHCAEFALIGALVINQPSPLVIALFALALVGWAWSLAHLPGRTA